jgi:hypothetical protein
VIASESDGVFGGVDPRGGGDEPGRIDGGAPGRIEPGAGGRIEPGVEPGADGAAGRIEPGADGTGGRMEPGTEPGAGGIAGRAPGGAEGGRTGGGITGGGAEPGFFGVLSSGGATRTGIARRCGRRYSLGVSGPAPRAASSASCARRARGLRG